MKSALSLSATPRLLKKNIKIAVLCYGSPCRHPLIYKALKIAYLKTDKKSRNL